MLWTVEILKCMLFSETNSSKASLTVVLVGVPPHICFLEFACQSFVPSVM